MYVQIIKYVGVSLFSPQTILLPFAQEQRVQRKKRIFYSERVTHMESFLYFHANQRITIAGWRMAARGALAAICTPPWNTEYAPSLLYLRLLYILYRTCLHKGFVCSRPASRNSELIKSLQIYQVQKWLLQSVCYSEIGD